MGNEVSVFRKMTTSTELLCEALKKEIGIKNTSIPFAVRAFEALNTLRISNETEGRLAANKFLDGLQTLIMGGTLTEDYDQIDFVKRGETITLSVRVGGLIRAAARKGYRMIATFVPVPKDSTIYFSEIMQGGEICYILHDDHRFNDRAINAERFIGGYFDKFICRLEIRAVKNNARIAMTAVEMSNAEVMAAHDSSDNGLYLTEWATVDGRKCKRRKKNEKGEYIINKNSFWYKWTSEMIYKTVLRRAIKKVRDALPELENTFYSFDEQPIIGDFTPQEKPIETPNIKTENVNMKSLTPGQKQDGEDMKENYKANPKMAELDANLILSDFAENKRSLDEIINDKYAEIYALKSFKQTADIIKPITDAIKGVVK